MPKKVLFITGLLIFGFLAILGGGVVFASTSTTTGEIETGIETGPEGVVKAAPTASPVAGTYNVNKDVSLTASGATIICYTADGATPACSGSSACSNGIEYGSAISVTQTITIKAVACYADGTEGPDSSDLYTLACAITIVANGSVGAYPGCAITCNSGYTLSGNTCVASGGGGGGGGGGAVVTPPQISDVLVVANTNSAVATWKTNILSTSYVKYGLTTTYGQFVSSVTHTKNHSMSITGLTPLTTYHYRVKSVSTDGGITTYTDKTFTTLAEKQLSTGQASATPSQGGEIIATTETGASAKVTVPAGAVSADTQFTVTPMGTAAAMVGSPPSGSFMVGDYVFNFSADVNGTAVTTFSESLTLTFTYTEAQISGLDESTLTIYWWDADNSQWVALTTTIDADNNTLTVTITHFTYFAMMGEEEEEVVEEPVVTPPTELTLAELKAKIAEIQALIAQLLIQLQELIGEAKYTGIPAGFTFTNNLSQGDVGKEIKYLQIVLNADTSTRVASTGVGSPGNETTYFGTKTKAAVIKFQEKYKSAILAPWGFTKGTGIVGRTTRGKLNDLLK